MRCTIVLEFDEGEGSEVKRIELMRLHRDTDNPAAGDVGLSLAEGKSLSNCVQQEFVTEQLGRFSAGRRTCACCGLLPSCQTSCRLRFPAGQPHQRDISCPENFTPFTPPNSRSRRCSKPEVAERVHSPALPTNSTCVAAD